MDILVINLMRLGDLIQSGPVLRGLRRLYPQARITLMVLDIFRDAATLLQPVDRLAVFPSLALAQTLEQAGWPAAGRLLGRWLQENLKPRPTLAVNLTPTLLAALLARVSGAPDLYGPAMSQGREFATWPPWASYSLVVSKSRWANPFNVVDLFAQAAGLAPDGQGLAVELPPAAREAAQKALAELRLPSGTARIGLMPGASRPERQWPPEQFAQAARLLAQQRPCHFFLIGGAGERRLGEAVQARLPAGAATLKAGETGVQELAGWLAELDLLITNDTGPMHLAAAVGTKVLGLFLASARIWDTGPAGAGHLAVAPKTPCQPCSSPCSRPRCHHDLTPEAVARLAMHLLAREHRSVLDETSEWAGIEAYVTAIDPAGHQAALPLIRRPLSRGEFWRWVHRLAWELLLAGTSGRTSLEPWLERVLRRHYLPASDDLDLAESLTALGELEDLARQGMEQAGIIQELAAGGALTPGVAARIRKRLAACEAIDGGLRRLAAGFPETAALVAFFFQDQRLREGGEIMPLARDLRRAYEVLGRAAAVCREAAGWLTARCPTDPDRVYRIIRMAQPVQNGVRKDRWQETESEVKPCLSL